MVPSLNLVNIFFMYTVFISKVFLSRLGAQLNRYSLIVEDLRLFGDVQLTVSSSPSSGQTRDNQPHLLGDALTANHEAADCVADLHDLLTARDERRGQLLLSCKCFNLTKKKIKVKFQACGVKNIPYRYLQSNKIGIYHVKFMQIFQSKQINVKYDY